MRFGGKMPGRTPKSKYCFIASDRPKGQEALAVLTRRYGQCAMDEASVIVVLGGDGTLLDVLRHTMHLSTPVYGMNTGTVGFLMNTYNPDDLPRRLAEADLVRINPLRMLATDSAGKVHEAMAINEIALLRQSRQTARLTVTVGGRERLAQLICDGIMIATPAGSTAYNLSAHGPVLPISSNLLALTPISPFRPRRWRGALLPYDASVVFDVQDADFRTVLATADNIEVRDVVRVEGAIARDVEMVLLFDKGAGLEERVLEEQFEY